MSDYAVLGLLAILGPVFVVGAIAQIVLWADKPLPYDENTNWSKPGIDACELVGSGSKPPAELAETVGKQTGGGT